MENPIHFPPADWASCFRSSSPLAWTLHFQWARLFRARYPFSARQGKPAGKLRNFGAALPVFSHLSNSEPLEIAQVLWIDKSHLTWDWLITVIVLHPFQLLQDFVHPRATKNMIDYLPFGKVPHAPPFLGRNLWIALEEASTRVTITHHLLPYAGSHARSHEEELPPVISGPIARSIRFVLLTCSKWRLGQSDFP